MFYKQFTDEELMEQIVLGDEVAFNEVCVRYKQQIYNYVFRHVRNVEDAEDLTQDTFKALYEGAFTYDRKKGMFRGFVFGISRKKTYYHLRERGKLPKQLVNEENCYNFMDSMDPSKIIENKELTETVMDALNLLPAKEREVLNLRLDNFKLEEIANVLQTNYNAVKAASSRGVLSLREKLRGLGYGRK